MSTVHTKATITGRSFVVVAALAVLLSGCSGSGAASGSASATAQLGDSAQPASTDTPQAPAEATGCPATDGLVPAGAATAEIEDVDGDGQNDTQWYSEATVPFVYGITTASGATATISDSLAGPGAHSGWTARMHNDVVVTVLDDGRSADLYAFVDCAFVTPIGVDARPYTFDMQNLRGYGTGVGCLEVENGLELNGLQVTENRDDSFSLMSTGITVAADGLTAMNGYTDVATALAAEDRQVALANTSSCAGTPVVSTSGR